jgi:hypothetical protein
MGFELEMTPRCAGIWRTAVHRSIMDRRRTQTKELDADKRRGFSGCCLFGSPQKSCLCYSASQLCFSAGYDRFGDR